MKVMQCFRCKAFGHRTNDKVSNSFILHICLYHIDAYIDSYTHTLLFIHQECPLAKQGNLVLDSERQAREDPMSIFVAKKAKERQEKYERGEQLKLIVDEIRSEEAERRGIRRERETKRIKRKRKSINIRNRSITKSITRFNYNTSILNVFMLTEYCKHLHCVSYIHKL